MKKDFLILLSIYLFYSITLSASSCITVSNLALAVKLFAALIAITLGGIYLRRRGPIEGEEPFRFLGDKKRFLTTLPLFAPTVGIIMVIAYLTNLLLSTLGYTPVDAPSEPLLLSIILHGVIPAICEELLFRYLPIKFLL